MNNITKSGSIVKCEKCQTEVYKSPSRLKKSNNRHFCSIQCRNSTIKRQSDKPRRVCKLCNKNIIMYANLTGCCQSCLRETTRNKLENMSLSELQTQDSVMGKHPSWLNSNVRNLCRSWNSNLIKEPCQFCGYSNHIELCHIKPVQSFDKDTKLKIINAPENILVLCPNHHWEFDNELIKIQDIKPRKGGYTQRDSNPQPNG